MEPRGQGRRFEHRSPYALRHSYAAWSIATGRIGLFELSRLMSTSVDQLDKTYGHMLPDSIDRARAARDVFADGLRTDAAEPVVTGNAGNPF